MPEEYPHAIWSRAKWQAERDKANVPKGASLRISMGDELDRFHAVFRKGVGPAAVAACKRLGEKAEAYATAVQKKHPAWAKRVRGMIGDRTGEILGDLDKIDKAKDAYNRGVQIVHKAWPHLESEVAEFVVQQREGTKLKSRFMDAMVAGLKEVHTHGQRLVYVTDAVGRDIWNEARVCWYAVDGGRDVDKAWLKKVEDLVYRLKLI